MRILCLKFSLLAKKRANKPVRFYKIKRKQKRCFICFTWRWNISLANSTAPTSVWTPLDLLYLSSVLLFQVPSQLAAQARGEKETIALKMSILKRHLKYFTTTSVLRGLEHYFFTDKIFIFNAHGHRLRSSVQLVYVGQNAVIQAFLLVPSCKGLSPYCVLYFSLHFKALESNAIQVLCWSWRACLWFIYTCILTE